MPTVSLTPPALIARASSVSELAGDWLVAQVIPRHEKSLAWDLGTLKIGYYLPLVQVVRVLSGKKRRLNVPLFGGYLFCCPADAGEQYEVLDHPSVYSSIRVTDPAQLVDELTAIEAALKRNATIDPAPFAEIGTKCRVSKGKLVGFEGEVIHRSDDRTRVTLSVTSIGGNASLEVDADLVELAKPDWN